MKQYIMDKLDPKFKIKIKQQMKNGEFAIVEAPLPEQFGFTVGSEFSAPFDASTLGGVLQKLKVPASMGVAKRVGVVTTKFYSNPEPTEISFDIEFHAEYSARHEVAEPVLALMAMSLGDAMTFESAMEALDGVRGKLDAFVSSITGDSDASEDGEEEPVNTSDVVSDSFKKGANDAMALLGLIEGPDTTTIRFGNLYSIDNVWVSSVAPQFSNVVDAEGFPLSANVSVTAIIQRDPVRGDLYRFFGAEQPRGQS